MDQGRTRASPNTHAQTAQAEPPHAEATHAATNTEDETPVVDPNAPPLREIPVDWESLEDAFENNAPEVHSYLQAATGEVIRVVDGVADPHLHARIAADPGYLRIDPVSSREQYRWMERFIPMVESVELRGKLHQAIDGKGAFRRFKDALMAHAEDRERWFTFRSERLRTFMDAWLAAHSMKAVAKPAWTPPPAEAAVSTLVATPPGMPSLHEQKRRAAEQARRQLREIADGLGPRDLETLCALAEFLKVRRATRLAQSVQSAHEEPSHDDHEGEEAPSTPHPTANVGGDSE